jgi:pyruvate/2-oxoglutarate/acetoin dehydrogenase E1 component
MGDVLTYFDQITLAMKKLAENENVIFLGQCVGYPGNALHRNLESIDSSRRIEMPVAEDLQMGMSIGLALNGFIPVTVYPRFDFLLLASNQLANHLDKFPSMSNGRVKPKVIIRVCVGSTDPLHPGIQHCSDYSEAFSSLLKTVELMVLNKADEVLPAYTHALEREDGVSTVLVEKADLYGEI